MSGKCLARELRQIYDIWVMYIYVPLNNWDCTLPWCRIKLIKLPLDHVTMCIEVCPENRWIHIDNNTSPFLHSIFSTSNLAVKSAGHLRHLPKQKASNAFLFFFLVASSTLIPTSVKLLYTQVLRLTVCDKWSSTVQSTRNIRKMGDEVLFKSTSVISHASLTGKESGGEVLPISIYLPMGNGMIAAICSITLQIFTLPSSLVEITSRLDGYWGEP